MKYKILANLLLGTISGLIVMFTILIIMTSAEPTGVSVPISRYKIDTTGYSNGMVIPAPFYFHINSLSAEIDAGAGFLLYCYSYNKTDTLSSIKVPNDSINRLEYYPISLTEVDTMTLEEMVQSRIRQRLYDLYGESNVTGL